MKTTAWWLGAAVLAAGATMSIWILWLGGGAVANRILAGNRATVYSTVASISGSLLGFIIAAVSIVIAYSTSNRLSLVSSSGRYPELVRVFFGAIKAFGLATVAALVALIVDRDATPAPVILCLCILAVAWAVSRFLRCISVFETVIRIVTAPSKERSGEDA